MTEENDKIIDLLYYRFLLFFQMKKSPPPRCLKTPRSRFVLAGIAAALVVLGVVVGVVLWATVGEGREEGSSEGEDVVQKCRKPGTCS